MDASTPQKVNCKLFNLKEYPASSYYPLDLSVENAELTREILDQPEACWVYIQNWLSRANKRVAWGGYLERRKLYQQHQNFNASPTDVRDVHLGVDYWLPAGTPVIAPWEGIIHSFADNNSPGDYGPTLILKHPRAERPFYSLYGHLSRESLETYRTGKGVAAGDILGRLGSPQVNGGYAPHLHFQLILDLEGNFGDYPGVCSIKALEHYQKNCPNPGTWT